MEQRASGHDPNDVQVNFWAPRQLRSDLRRVAKKQDTKVGQILRQLAREYVEAHDAQTAAA
jgi:molybdopterin-guanine dinucleotide biosynthesis protein A